MIDPKTLKKWLIALALVYLIFPRDLIPDFLGRGLGLIDDFFLMGVLTYYFRNYVRRYLETQAARERAAPGAGGPRAGAHDAASGAVAEAYAVLGIASGASQREIQAAYRARMSEYHPDKVAHLGEDLQKLAHRKSLEIQQAYQRLRR